MAKKKVHHPDQHLIDFSKPVEPSMHWPANEYFPLNRKSHPNDFTVIQEIIKDINQSENYLVVTGFTSLAHIIKFFGKEVDFQNLGEVRIILGFEPEKRTKKVWNQVELDKEIKDYWLENDYSVLHGGEVIRIIELIKEGKIKFKILDGLHAKIYVGDKHAILGSANFSKNGTTVQQEANIRIENSLVNAGSAQQYSDINLIANNFYQLGRNYKNEILDLLKDLLKIVTWQEALARAIAELVERNWLKDLPELYDRINSANLWPSQRTGLAQALYILQTQGCVLIADPTGSGKTKLISTLQIVLFHWLWETGRRSKSFTLTICPPLVQETWSQEFLNLHFSQNAEVSMGILSNKGSLNHTKALQKIKIANILVIDEAHNYLSSKSNRSNSIEQHTSDNIILSTATPISKKAKDLLRLVELLGVDNLNDQELEQFGKLKRLSSIKKKEDLDMLRSYMKNFIVRRTKNQLNKLIQKEPHKYTNRKGEPCRYPKNRSLTYETGESVSDINIAGQINKLSKKLKGIIFLQDFSRPEEYYEFDESTYIEKRLKAAIALTVFNIQAKLRSSKVALIEHIEGTDAVTNEFKFKTSKNKSGNFISKIKECSRRLPKNQFDTKYFPTWLTNLSEYKKACDEEISGYKEIALLTRSLSNTRDKSKVKRIIELFKKHELVLAFDSTIITLDYLNTLLKEEFKGEGIESHVVTGNTSKTTIIRKFEPGSNATKVLGLCSDSMSEGVNLQQASALVFLDMPSVLRIAEQRIGRIDRLDSPHKEIEVYWPNDTDEFALKTDSKLIKTSIDTDSLIGSNFDIPTEIMDKHLDSVIKPADMINALREFEEKDFLWEGLQDAFQPVHDLYEGENAILRKEDYEYLKEVDALVKVKLCIGMSDKPWLFLALKGGKHNSPRWYFIDSDNKIYLELPEICQQLRSQLGNTKSWESKWTDQTKTALEKYVRILQQNEINILPNKRRRALEVAKYILEMQREVEKNNKDKTKHRLINQILALFRPLSPDSEFSLDYYAFSQLWLDILNPYLRDKINKRKSKKKVISLLDLKIDYKSLNFTSEVLQELLNNAPYTTRIWDRVASCIIGLQK